MNRVAPVLLAALLNAPALAASLTPVYRGVIPDWPRGGAGEVRLELGDHRAFARADVDAEGRFVLVLPDAARVRDFLDPVGPLFAEASSYGPHCRGEGGVMPANARMAFFSLWAYAGGERLGRLDYRRTSRLPLSGGAEWGWLLFLDGPAVLNGTVTCAAFRDLYRGGFDAGWSLTAARFDGVDGSGVEWNTITNAATPEGLAWWLYEEESGVGLDAASREGGAFVVSGLEKGHAAERAGVRVGDEIVEVDGGAVAALTLAALRRRLAGEVSTTVTLGVKRPGEPDVRHFTLTRALVRRP